MKKRFLGFTLSETLITVAILGVIAMLTIPGIIRNYQKRVWVTQLQRWYSEMSNTIDEFVVLNKGLDTYTTGKGVSNLSELNKSPLISFLNEKYGDLYADWNKNNGNDRSTALWKNNKNTLDYQTLHKANRVAAYPNLNSYFFLYH